MSVSNIPNEYLCPITMGPMSDPVRTKCSHVFERKALTEWLQKSSKCPLCQATITSVDLKSEEQFRLQISTFLMQHPEALSQPSPEASTPIFMPPPPPNYLHPHPPSREETESPFTRIEQVVRALFRALIFVVATLITVTARGIYLLARGCPL